MKLTHLLLLAAGVTAVVVEELERHQQLQGQRTMAKVGTQRLVGERNLLSSKRNLE